VAGRSIQRIGLSATVGNPADLLDWLQGAGKDGRSAVVVSPDPATAAPAVPGGAGGPPHGDIEAGLCGVGEQRRNRDRLAAPGREAAGVL